MTKQERKSFYLCCVSMRFLLSSLESPSWGPCAHAHLAPSLVASRALPPPASHPPSCPISDSSEPWDNPNIQGLYLTPPYSTSAPRPGFPPPEEGLLVLPYKPHPARAAGPHPYTPPWAPAHCLRQEPRRPWGLGVTESSEAFTTPAHLSTGQNPWDTALQPEGHLVSSLLPPAQISSWGFAAALTPSSFQCLILHSPP